MNNKFLKNFFRTDLELEKKWWHRLLKISFIIITLTIFSILALIFSEEESFKAREYQIIENFADYIKKAESDCRLLLGAKSNSEKNEYSKKLSCSKILVPSFLNNFDNYLLGCINKDNKIDELSIFLFEKNVVCSTGPNYKCEVPQNICKGNILNIVKYDYHIKYNFFNYISIIFKSLIVVIGWILVVNLLYYKGIIYIIFGNKKNIAISD
jgi:hypothetical protein